MDRHSTNINDHPYCENCGCLVNAVIVCDYDEHPLVFCSYRCFNEYRICDGGDDNYYSKQSIKHQK